GAPPQGWNPQGAPPQGWGPQGGPPQGWQAAGPPGQPGQDPTEVVGKRIGAGIIDFFLMVVLFFIVGIALGEGESGDGNASVTLEGGSALVYFALLLGYYIVTEAVWNATLGKRALGLVVRSADGSKPSTGQIVGRNLLRIVDGFFFYLVGLITIVATKRKQRLGDLAAGTIVVPRQP
ncbi:MAG TPA: RDD family protein, partial [Thermoleophilaceae bacterium]